MPNPIRLDDLGIFVRDLHRNLPVARLYEYAIARERSAITATGALATNSGAKTGRSPKDKRVVRLPASEADIHWGDVNIPLDDHTFVINRQRALDFLNCKDYLYVVDGYAGWSPRRRMKVRIVCARAYHALFMRNMLIRPTAAELADFGKPDLLILNAGQFPANPHTAGMNSNTSVDLCFERREMVILGTEYAGEMKKGVFTAMNYLMPKAGVLSMHCSANEGPAGDGTLFFGLSGTGKTTLSADPRRRLIGDDEHCWDDDGVFNIEGGCYAKCAGLSHEREPEIFDAIRFGAILENVALDPETRLVDYDDIKLTENTRCAYPLEYIPNAKLPALGGHPKNVVFLTCDAFGVLPPVARLSTDQALYHFISGYTAKVAGTEQGVTEPSATFSACYGAAFMAWPPAKYAGMLAERLERHGSHCWLVNTGWTGGGYGSGQRIKLAHTRAMIDAIHDGSLAQVPCDPDPVFGVGVPRSCPGVPTEILRPAETWPDRAAYAAAAQKVAGLFAKNLEKHSAGLSPGARAAGPQAA